jgi:hypothetical protein
VPTIAAGDVEDTATVVDALKAFGVAVLPGFDDGQTSAAAGELFVAPDVNADWAAGGTGHPFRGLRAFHDDLGQRCWRRWSIGRFDDVAQARAAGVDERFLPLYEAPNVWPSSTQVRSALAGFRERATSWTSEIVPLATDGLALGAPDNANLAVSEYDPGVDERGRAVYFDEHSDLSALTFIVQDGAPGGLQVWLGDSWCEPATGPGDAVVLVGDWLHRASCGRLPAGAHRVLATSAPRRSVVALVFPELGLPVLPGTSARPTAIDDGATIGEVLLGSVERYMTAAAPGEVRAWQKRTAYRSPASDGKARGRVPERQ